MIPATGHTTRAVRLLALCLLTTLASCTDVPIEPDPKPIYEPPDSTGHALDTSRIGETARPIPASSFTTLIVTTGDGPLDRDTIDLELNPKYDMVTFQVRPMTMGGKSGYAVNLTARVRLLGKQIELRTKNRTRFSPIAATVRVSDTLYASDPLAETVEGIVKLNSFPDVGDGFAFTLENPGGPPFYFDTGDPFSFANAFVRVNTRRRAAAIDVQGRLYTNNSGDYLPVSMEFRAGY